MIDPVIPAALDGLTARTQIAGHPVKVTYRIKRKGCGTISVSLNGKELDFNREPNPYRTGAVRIRMESITASLTGSGDEIEIWME